MGEKISLQIPLNFVYFDFSLGFQRELKRKLQVSRQSLQKVETACYTVQVRGSEIPKELLAAKAVLSDDNPWNEDYD